MNPINDQLFCGYVHDIFDFNHSDIGRFPRTIYPLIYKFIVPLDLKAMTKYMNDMEHENRMEIATLKKTDSGPQLHNLHNQINNIKTIKQQQRENTTLTKTRS